MSTLRTLSAIVISIAMLAAVAPGAGAQSTHASLDWNASYRWVHVDNIGPDPMAVFERARTGWLQALRQGDSLLADGRPLFSFEDATVDSLWKELRTALAAEHYPLTCRVLQNVYGSSDIICMWLAPDSTALRAAPRMKDVVTRHLGVVPAKKLWKRLDAVFPVTSTLTVERRPELSNLGK